MANRKILKTATSKTAPFESTSLWVDAVCKQVACRGNWQDKAHLTKQDGMDLISYYSPEGSSVSVLFPEKRSQVHPQVEPCGAHISHLHLQGLVHMSLLIEGRNIKIQSTMT